MTKGRKCALIINVKEFSDESWEGKDGRIREGTAADWDRMEKVLQDLGFEVKVFGTNITDGRGQRVNESDEPTRKVSSPTIVFGICPNWFILNHLAAIV